MRIHDCRLASTTIDSGDGDALALAGSTDVDVDGLAGEGTTAAATGLGDSVDFAGGWFDADEVLCPRIHHTDPPSTITPAATNSATNARIDRPGGTGTESLGKGEDSSARDAVDDPDDNEAIDSNSTDDSNGRSLES